MSSVHCRPRAASAWRLELFFKNKEDLRAQLPFLQSQNISRINLTNKTNRDDLLESVKILQASLPQLDVAVHYSVKYNYERTPEPTFKKFINFRDGLEEQLCSSGAATGHILLVSGGGKKKQLDSLAIVQKLAVHYHQQQQQHRESAQLQQEVAVDAEVAVDTQQHYKEQQKPFQINQSQQQQPSAKRPRICPSTVSMSLSSSITSCKAALGVHVAFNPYLQDPIQLEQEQVRLQLKLNTGLVKGVYLQMGTDLHKLKQGLQHLQLLLKTADTARAGDMSPSGTKACPRSELAASSTASRSSENDGGSKVTVFGSVFLPSKRLLAQMKFRPWNGVFLSDEYLSSVEAADGVTRQLLKVYADHGVVPLVESAVKTDAEMGYVKELLTQAYGARSTQDMV